MQSIPKVLASPFAKIVLPLPKSPDNAKTSPPLSVLANFFANFIVCCSDLEINRILAHKTTDWLQIIQN
jgi:hypothetical protein